MKWLIFIFLGVPLLATPFRVPQEFYSGFGKNGNHPGNAPLISDVTFRAISDHIIDQDAEWFDPGQVQLGDIIYLNAWYMEWFEKEIHDQIRFPYILITCDVGDWLPHPNFQRLLYDPKLATWFCRNSVFSYHPKIIQLAYGQNDRLFEDAPLTYLKELILKKPFEKKFFLYMNYLPRPFGDRDKIYKLFENESYCFSRNHTGVQFGGISRWVYFDELAASQFVISPLGLETDCVRTWEALALGCIPIVEHTFLDPLFEGMPVVFVHEWTEINENFLKEKYELLKDRKSEKVFFDYWHRMVKDAQNKIRNNNLSSSQLEATQFDSQDLDDLIAILKEEASTLIYKGFGTTIHALELANAAPFLSKIQLCDPWMDQKTLRSFADYLKDPSLLKNQKKISLISFKMFDTVFPNLSRSGNPIFLDFTYYRNSLVRDKYLKIWRHSLKKDLSDLYQTISSGTFVCGNMFRDTYVKEVLDKFSAESNVSIKTQGNFWFFVK